MERRLGTALTIAGVLTHFTVAFTWSTIFLLAYDNWPLLPRIAASRFGIARIAAVYGPIVWMVMSLIVIPARTGRSPAITYRWWVQFFGHMIFVGLPIVAMIARPRQPFVPTNYPASS